MLNKRQAIILLTFTSLATKLQRLPSLISINSKQDGWLVLLILGLFDFLLLIVALWFITKFQQYDLFEMLKQIFGNVVARICALLVAIYFFIKAVLPFEAIHDLFANNLFNQVDYHFFGIIFLVVVAFMAIKGLKNLGRQSELYLYHVIIGIVGVLILGGINTDFSNSLPMCQTDFNILIMEILKSSLWFGDFIILFLFCGHIKIENVKKLWIEMMLSYFVVLIVIVPLFYWIFYARYQVLAGYQTNAISSLTQFSLLELDLGRIDWILVLLEQIATIICASLYILISGEKFSIVFNIKRKHLIMIIIAVLLFGLDIFVFRDLNSSAFAFMNMFYVFAIVCQLGLTMVFIIGGLTFNKTKQTNSNEVSQND